MSIRSSKLSGFGHAITQMCEQYRPEKMHGIKNIIDEHGANIISRGLGRAYGDQALNEGGVLHMQRLDRMLAFDEVSGVLTAEAGVTLADILTVCIPKGWMPAVIPGTKHITLGGAIACNVHGKNHFRQGEFGAHVKSLKLRLADGSLAECSPTSKIDLFNATIAGYGLTGIIEEATIQLMPVQSTSIQSVSYTVADLDQMMDAFETARDQADYMVGWIDHFGKNDGLGRGVFSAGRHVSEEDGGGALASFKLKPVKRSVPCLVPGFLLNKYTMALYNKRRFRKYGQKKTKQLESFDEFFHPLDSIKNWHRLYGKKGFLQYQFLIPDSEHCRAQLRDILQDIQYGDMFSYLAVIKYHGARSDGLLSFSEPGYSIALDFANKPKVVQFLSKLSDEIIAMGGQVYLAKDQILTSMQAGDMLKNNLSIWQKTTERFDENCKFQSAMSRRLMLKIDKQGTLL